ncbi:MAG: hypothetical protein ACPLPT_02415 [Moorellales bacterium]
MEAAAKGEAVVIVDVVDMSTTLESALEAGAVAVFGASPLFHCSPVPVSPGRVGYAAGQEAQRRGTEVVVVAEPRVGPECERRRQAGAVLAGIRAGGAEVAAVLPNLGKETPRLFPLTGRVVVAVTGSGGVAFDAAFNAGTPVTTATVARTYRSRGLEPAVKGARRALALARLHNRDLCVVAASGRCLEDLLAARFLVHFLASVGRRECFLPSRNNDLISV